VPSLAIVEGDVFGGGAELLFSCDFRLGMTGKHLKIPAAAVGLCYPVEGIQRMTQRLGSTLVRKLLLTTESVSFEELAQHNAFDWLLPPAEIKTDSEALINSLTGLAPLSIAAMLSGTTQPKRRTIKITRQVHRAVDCFLGEAKRLKLRLLPDDCER